MNSMIKRIGNKKHKLIFGVAAVTVAAVTLLTGTLAWTSISQEAINEKATFSNPGGRLHDDFDGTNKDVYVENFTDPENNGEPIFARIRLDEYMEIGDGAGLKDGQEGYEQKTAVPAISTADINDPATWKTHIPGAADDPFHGYFTWKLGGSTIYMPTFNKNKDSLEADINGTLEGTTPGDDTHYDDYETYTDGQTKTGDAIYDADENDIDEGAAAVVGTNIEKVSEEHTAQSTLTAKVMTMADWIAAGSVPGPFWVYDADGWAYWAQAIQPGEATGLLLDEITQISKPAGKSYYAIHVVSQFATADDIGSEESGSGFYGPNAGKKPSENARKLLDQAVAAKHRIGENGSTYLDYGDNTFRLIDVDGSLDPQLICGGADMIPGNADDRTDVTVLDIPNETYGSKFLGKLEDGTYLAVGEDGKLGTDDDIIVRGTPELTDGIEEYWPVETMRISAAGNATKVFAGNSLQFTARLSGKGHLSTNQDVTWTIDGNKLISTTIESDGKLNVAADETADAITVTATSIENPSVSETRTVTVGSVAEVAAKAEKEVTAIGRGNKLRFTAEVTGNNLDMTDKSVTWSVSGNTSASTEIDKDGWLTVGADETAPRLTVTAVSKRNAQKIDMVDVSVTVTIDGVEFYILANNQNNESLLLSRYVLERSKVFGTNSKWNGSNIQDYLNGDWLTNHTTIRNKAAKNPITTRATYNGSEYDETTDQVFLLSEADVNGSHNYNTETAVAKDYTAGEKLTPPVGGWAATTSEGVRDYWWLRSPCTYDYYVVVVTSNGSLYNNNIRTSAGNGVRPALWMDLSNLKP